MSDQAGTVASAIRALAKEHQNLPFSPEELFSRLGPGVEHLRDIAFIIITPDSLMRGIEKEVLDFVTHEAQVRILSARLKYMSDYDIEELYKYTFRQKIVEDQVTFWWLMRKSFQIYPCLSLLLHGTQHNEQFLCQTLLNLKGSFVVKCAPVRETIRARFTAISRILAVVHSSDDILSMTREILLFFSQQELASLVQDPSRHVPQEDVHKLLAGNGSAADSGDEVLNRIATRVIYSMKLKYSAAPEVKDALFALLDDRSTQALSRFDGRLDRLRRTVSDEDFLCLKILSAIFGVDKENRIEQYGRTLRNAHIFLTEWEDIVLQNRLFFHK